MDFDKVFNELVHKYVSLVEYTSLERMGGNDYDPAYTRKIGKQIDKSLKIILNTEEGIKKMKGLLDNPDLRLAFFSAKYLFPIYPKKCIDIMCKYRNTLEEDLEIHEVSNVIEGYKDNTSVFFQVLKKLYNCDLETLLNE